MNEQCQKLRAAESALREAMELEANARVAETVAALAYGRAQAAVEATGKLVTEMRERASKATVATWEAVRKVAALQEADREGKP